MRLPEPQFRMVSFGGYSTMDVDQFIDRVEAAWASEPPTITAGEVQSVVFTRARTHGYAAADVDDWLDLVVRSLGRDGVTDANQSVRPSGPVTAGPSAPAPDTAVPEATGPVDRSDLFESTRRPADRSADRVSPAGPGNRSPVPTARDVGLVRQTHSIPRPLLLIIVAAVVVAVVLAIYFSA